MPVRYWLYLLLGGLALGLATPGYAASRDFQIDSFERIYLRGDALVRLDQQAAGSVATARGSQRRLDKLNLENADGVLYIDAGDGAAADQLVIRVPVGYLREIVNEGRGTVASSRLQSAALAVEGHGAGRIELSGLQVDDLVVVGVGTTRFAMSGAARHQVVELSGQGNYDAARLATETSQIDVRGTGLVELWVEELLDISLFGDARVRYSGTPWVLQHVQGAGVIDQLP